MKNILLAFTFGILASIGAHAKLNCVHPAALHDKIDSSVKLAPLTKTLNQLGAKNQYGAHGMKAKFLTWLTPIYKTCGHAPTDWPFRQGKAYPGLWTAYTPDTDNQQHIDANVLNADGSKDLRLGPEGDLGVTLRFRLDRDQKILWLTDFDTTDEIKAELASLKIKSAATPEQWQKWMHGRRETIRLAAEAGYSALFLQNLGTERSKDELVILNSSMIEAIEKLNTKTNNWEPLK